MGLARSRHWYLSGSGGPDGGSVVVRQNWERDGRARFHQLDCNGVTCSQHLFTTAMLIFLARYLLTLTAFQLLYGRLSDIFGRKPVLLFAFAVFGLGCLFCGLARTVTELIAARMLAGVGGGGFSTLSAIMLSDTVPLRDRGTWQGYRNVVFAIGLATGVSGGAIADSLGWRW